MYILNRIGEGFTRAGGGWCFLAMLMPYLNCGHCFAEQSGETKGRLEIRPRENPSAGFFYDESHALLIGNVHYQDPDWVDLHQIPVELGALAKTLEAQGFQIFEGRVHLDQDEDGMRKLIETFIETHGLANEHNRLIIVYSGHGETLNGKDGYLVPIDAPDPNEDMLGFRRRALPIRHFHNWALEAQAKHILFAFDSCFGGTVFSTRSLRRKTVQKIGKLTGKPVRIMMSAGNVSEEVPAVSAFTPYLTRGISGEGDLNRDGFVTGTELFAFVRDRVSLATADTTENTVRFAALPHPYDQGDMVFEVPNIGPDMPAPTPVKTYGSLIVKSPRAGQVRLDGQGPVEIAAGPGLEWKRLISGAHEIEVIVSGRSFNESVLIEEGQLTEVTAEFHGVEGERHPGFEFLEDNAVGMKFVYCHPGTYMGGNSQSEKLSRRPWGQVRIELTRGFWIGKYEVTQTQYESVMGVNPSHFRGENRPVETVTWREAREFCRRLTIQERRHGRLDDREVYRLPTESEWEYACRAGTETPYSFGQDINPKLANHGKRGGFGGSTRIVGSYQANDWGLYDMHGNVAEWCLDWFDLNRSSGKDPVGPSSGNERVIRGGAWYDPEHFCRSGDVASLGPNYEFNYVGFRVVRAVNSEVILRIQ